MQINDPLTLDIGGGTLYYFTTKSSHCTVQPMEGQRRREMPSRINNGPPGVAVSGPPSQESAFDPAATRHAPYTEGERARDPSKFEASDNVP